MIQPSVLPSTWSTAMLVSIFLQVKEGALGFPSFLPKTQAVVKPTWTTCLVSKNGSSNHVLSAVTMQGN